MLIKLRFLIIFTLSQITVATFLGRHLIINRCHRRHLPTLKNNFFSLICQISSFFALEAKSRGFLVWNFFFDLPSRGLFSWLPHAWMKRWHWPNPTASCLFLGWKDIKKILGKGLIDKWIRESFSRLCSSQKNSLKITIKSLIISQ